MPSLVVAILDSRLPASVRFDQSAHELLDPGIMRIAVEISLACIQAEIHVISNLFPVSVAIYDLPITLTSSSNGTIPFVLFDPENEGIAVGILLLSCVQPEIYVFEV